MPKEGQIILKKEKEEKPKTKIEVKVDFRRLLFYGIVALFIYFLLSYSYKLILKYEDFYYLINTYAQSQGDIPQNNILVIIPVVGEKVYVPFLIKGKVRPFDNNLIVQLRSYPEGQLLYKDKAEIIVSSENKQYDDFLKEVRISSPLPSQSNDIIIELYLESPSGSKSNLVTIPVQLQEIR